MKGLFGLWESEYFAKKAMREAIDRLGLVEDDVYITGNKYGAWISPILARAMVRHAGFEEGEVDAAFSHADGVAPFITQPQLEGSIGDILKRARMVRPNVPGRISVTEHVKSLNGMILRTQGEYVDATLVLGSAGRKWTRYASTTSHDRFFKSFLEQSSVHWPELVISTPEGRWVHWTVAAKICAWVQHSENEVFAMMLHHGIAREDEVAECRRLWRCAHLSAPNTFRESVVRDRLVGEIGGSREVKLAPGMTCDILNDVWVVECKHGRSLRAAAQAIGQASLYHEAVSNRKCRVHLFGTQKEIDTCQDSRELARVAVKNDAEITYEVVVV
jgi:hypothetical protein